MLERDENPWSNVLAAPLANPRAFPKEWASKASAKAPGERLTLERVFTALGEDERAKKYQLILKLPSVWRKAGIHTAAQFLDYWLYGLPGTPQPRSQTQAAGEIRQRRVDNVLGAGDGALPIWQGKLDFLSRGTLGGIVKRKLEFAQKRLEAYVADPASLRTFLEKNAGDAWKKAVKGKKDDKFPFGDLTPLSYPSVALNPDLVPSADNLIERLNYWDPIDHSSSDFDAICSLGDFRVRTYVAGVIVVKDAKKLRIEVTQFGWRVRDEFQFQGDQPLGYWSERGFHVNPLASGAYWLTNQVFSDFARNARPLINSLIGQYVGRSDVRWLTCQGFTIYTPMDIVPFKGLAAEIAV